MRAFWNRTIPWQWYGRLCCLLALTVAFLTAPALAQAANMVFVSSDCDVTAPTLYCPAPNTSTQEVNYAWSAFSAAATNAGLTPVDARGTLYLSGTASTPLSFLLADPDTKVLVVLTAYVSPNGARMAELDNAIKTRPDMAVIAFVDPTSSSALTSFLPTVNAIKPADWAPITYSPLNTSSIESLNQSSPYIAAFAALPTITSWSSHNAFSPVPLPNTIYYEGTAADVYTLLIPQSMSYSGQGACLIATGDSDLFPDGSSDSAQIAQLPSVAATFVQTALTVCGTQATPASNVSDKVVFTSFESTSTFTAAFSAIRDEFATAAPAGSFVDRTNCLSSTVAPCPVSLAADIASARLLIVIAGGTNMTGNAANLAALRTALQTRPDLAVVIFADASAAPSVGWDNAVTLLDMVNAIKPWNPNSTAIYLGASVDTARLNMSSPYVAPFGKVNTINLDAYTIFSNVPSTYALYTVGASATSVFVPHPVSNGGVGACVVLTGDVNDLANTTHGPAIAQTFTRAMLDPMGSCAGDVAHAPDLVPTLSGTTSITVGTSAAVTLTVSNAPVAPGAASANGQVQVTLPARVTVDPASLPTDCAAVTGNGGFVCNLPLIVAGNSISIPFQITASGTLANQPIIAMVSGVTGEINRDNNAATLLISATEQTSFAIQISFAGQVLQANAALTQPGQIAIVAQSAAGISRIQASVDGAAIIDQGYGNPGSATASQWLDFAAIANGVHALAVQVTDAGGGQTALNLPFNLNLSVPQAPVIVSPANGATVNNSLVSVVGTAQPGASIRVYVDGIAAGTLVQAASSGGFGTSVTLGQGRHTLTAKASNVRGTSSESDPVSITYAITAPLVTFTSPAPGAVLDADTQVAVSVTDEIGIAQVQFFANDQVIGTRSGLPWSVPWSIANAADGPYTLKAIATNTAGKTGQATRAVQVQKTAANPGQSQAPPYGTRNVTATPSLSFGQTPIQIQGEVVTGEGQTVANAPLRLLLSVQGFERRLSLVGDASGHFVYNFIPQPNDAGTYEVRVIHPDATGYAQESAQAGFSINRLSVNYGQYTLNAIRGLASSAQVNVSASAGEGATGVQWKALPADQPSGSLPPGITLDMGSPVDIAAGATAPINIKLTGSASAGESGTIILKLFAHESGEQPRAELRLDYRLYEAHPGLTPEPTTLEMGVQQNHPVSGKITLTNKGYAPAQNVAIALQTRDGGAAADWIHLDSAPAIGALDIGQSALIQISARPGMDVQDGYYQFQLKVTADNDTGGTVPITIAVARDGQGGIRFKLVDIYTDTLDSQGQRVEGLAGARITLQNEALTGDIRSATSNSQGIAEFAGIPPGNYRWRASAGNHLDASGRTGVYAGLTANERVFLDYQLVSIEFSVTETTLKDVYDLVLEATYQTQVPAPVVLIEPMSINLPALQQGEEYNGQLTVTNYGLVRADNLKFALPTGDENYRYEFFGVLPTQLQAKSRVSIPYRITALKQLAQGLNLDLEPQQQLQQITGGNPPSGQTQDLVRKVLSTGDTAGLNTGKANPNLLRDVTRAANCSSYQSQACVAYDYSCAAGDTRNGSSCASISRIEGSNCSVSAGGGGAGGAGGGGGGGAGGGGGWGGSGGTGASAPALELTPFCMPACADCAAGTGAAGGPGGGGSGK